MRKQRRTTGQALVEFTLAATLIFFLVSAAVDLGLIFFSVQALRTAAQEGANYGSYPIEVTSNGTTERVVLNYPEIINRIRQSAGNVGTTTPKSQGIVNFYDLNNNGIDDMDDGSISSSDSTFAPITTGRIQIDNPKGSDPTNLDVNNQCRNDLANRDMRAAGQNCWIRVRLIYTYEFFFPLAPAFGVTVDIPVEYVLQIRSSFSG